MRETDTAGGAARPVRPLDGIRAIEIASFIAGPFAGAQLAEFGAEVIKCELPGVGDPLRKFGTMHPIGETIPLLSECRNKKSVTLDVRKPEGAALLKELVARSDVLIENFQPGTMEKWGLGWAELSAVNPRLVMVRISGYGQSGPYAGRPGFGRIANAFGGLSYLAGYPDRAPVTPGSATIPDFLTGLYGAYGALLALRARDLTGRGQVIDIGLYESVFRILDELAGKFHLEGYVRERMGPGTVNTVPHSHYPTRDQRWIAIACTNDKIFARLAEAMGTPELAGADRWGRLAAREAARSEVDARVTRWTSAHDRAELIEICERFQVPCGPVASIAEIFEDPQYRARGNITVVSDPRSAMAVAVPSVVPRLTETPGSIDHLGPPLGADNAEVYGGLLGLDEARRDVLREAGVI
jgi:crotonobetainyl-CoA:carnitine CoA-transferase CaiB-like acyl-CoA transferase